jgi:aminoglycoside phosphotransferase (APT) family kinase protein
MWKPDHPVDAELAHQLIRAQFPELPDTQPTHVGCGFDADVWRVDDLVFRFPRRAVAVPLIAFELRVLPGLARRLSIAIPTPTHAGAPSPDFPYGFYGHPYLHGTTADRAALTDADRTALAPALGAFLRALHAVPVPEAEALGVGPDTFRSDHLARTQRAQEQLSYMEGTRWASLLPTLRDRLTSPASSPEGRPPVLLHGDLYARHLLLDDAKRLAGILDWGDISIGDASIDLDLVYGFLPPEARPAFWDAYGPIDAETHERARYTALTRHGILMMAYSLDVGDTVLEAEAGRILANALA